MYMSGEYQPTRRRRNKQRSHTQKFLYLLLLLVVLSFAASSYYFFLTPNHNESHSSAPTKPPLIFSLANSANKQQQQQTIQSTQTQQQPTTTPIITPTTAAATTLKSVRHQCSDYLTSGGGGERIKPNFQSQVCFDYFDCGFLQKWKKNRISMCAKSTDHMSSKSSGSLECYVTENPHIPAATRPHTICSSQNLFVDFSKLQLARCLKFRPGYMCDGTMSYYQYQNGALSAYCDIDNRNFQLTYFPNDFGKDIFSSFVNKSITLNNADLSSTATTVSTAPVTIFVSREKGEHANMFHATTDFFNAYLMIEFFGLDPQTVQIVILDDHSPGPYDMIWDKVFSLNAPMKRARDFNSKTVRFERAIFSPPGYTSIMLAHLTKSRVSDLSQTCTSELFLIDGYANAVLKGFGIPPRAPSNVNQLKLTFISRKPYSNYVEHKFMARQIANEDELLSELQSIAGVLVERVDFAQLTFAEQIQKAYESDILVGMHGAGLTHALWLPPRTSGVVELLSLNTIDKWRMFEQFTYWKGNEYREWSNSVTDNHWKDGTGDYTRINVAEVKALVSDVVSNIRKKQ